MLVLRVLVNMCVYPVAVCWGLGAIIGAILVGVIKAPFTPNFREDWFWEWCVWGNAPLTLYYLED